MYVCVYVCMYVCMTRTKWHLNLMSSLLIAYVCMYVRMYVCVWCRYVDIWNVIWISHLRCSWPVCVRVYVCVCVCACMWARRI
jgi:hypothetical protein